MSGTICKSVFSVTRPLNTSPMINAEVVSDVLCGSSVGGSRKRRVIVPPTGLSLSIPVSDLATCGAGVGGAVWIGMLVGAALSLGVSCAFAVSDSAVGVAAAVSDCAAAAGGSVFSISGSLAPQASAPTVAKNMAISSIGISKSFLISHLYAWICLLNVRDLAYAP